jgi:hypothetical protein
LDQAVADTLGRRLFEENILRIVAVVAVPETERPTSSDTVGWPGP